MSESTYLTRIDLAKEDMKFSAAHFTIFSATERERIHGHNFQVSASISARVDNTGLCFSYGDMKKIIRQLCTELDEYMLLPSQSPFLNISQNEQQIHVKFHNEELVFSSKDCRILPISNCTVEEFANYLLTELKQRITPMNFPIEAIEMRVSSGAGQWGAVSWNQ